MNSTMQATQGMTAAQAIKRLYEMFEATEAHFAAQGLTGQELYQVTSAFLMDRLGINAAR